MFFKGYHKVNQIHNIYKKIINNNLKKNLRFISSTEHKKKQFIGKCHALQCTAIMNGANVYRD